MQIIKDETLELMKKYGDERRTQIQDAAEELTVEDLIAEEEMVITISHAGYVKRLADFAVPQAAAGRARA